MSLSLLSNRYNTNEDGHDWKKEDTQRLNAEISELQDKILSKNSIIEKSEQSTQNMKTMEEIFDKEDEENELLKELTRRTAQNRLQLWPDSRDRRNSHEFKSQSTETQDIKIIDAQDACTQYSQRLDVMIENHFNVINPQSKGNVPFIQQEQQMLQQNTSNDTNQNNDVQKYIEQIEYQQNFPVSPQKFIESNLALLMGQNQDNNECIQENQNLEDEDDCEEINDLSRSRSIEHIINTDDLISEVTQQTQDSNQNTNQISSHSNDQNKDKLQLSAQIDDNQQVNSEENGNSTPSTVVQTIDEHEQEEYNQMISELEQQNTDLANEVTSQRNLINELQNQIDVLRRKLEIYEQKEQIYIAQKNEMVEIVAKIYQEVPKIIKQVQSLQEQLCVSSETVNANSNQMQ